MMKLAYVLLYLINLNGGQPELVVQFSLKPDTAMEQCLRTVEETNDPRSTRLVCVPIYKWVDE